MMLKQQKRFLEENYKYIREDGVMTKETVNDFVKVECLGVCYDYVYDIETESGTFQAGVGRLVVKNTDSIYTQFLLPNQDSLTREEEIEKIFEVSRECAQRISDTFKKPIELEMEKIMNPVMLFTKKRYIMNYIEHPTDVPKQDAKGIQIVRRDNCPYVKETCKEIAKKILDERDIEGAFAIAKQRVEELLQNKVPMEKLVLSKTLKKEYATENKDGRKLDKPAHWYLAQRMKTRDPMTAPQPGDRVPYVFIESKGTKQQDKVEEPEYVRKNGLKIDTLYYFEHQLKVPLITLFILLVTDKQGNVFEDTKSGAREAEKVIEEKIWKNAVVRKRNQMSGNRMITEFFAKTVQSTTHNTDIIDSEDSDNPENDDDNDE